jgi:hypothetical protein
MSEEARGIELFWEGLVHLAESFDMNGTRYFEISAKEIFENAILVYKQDAMYSLHIISGTNDRRVIEVSYADLVECLEQICLEGGRVLCVIEDMPSVWQSDDIEHAFAMVDLMQRISHIPGVDGRRLKLMISVNGHRRG